jgi:AAA+ ATPase superfamily predicted ATPase
MFVNRLKELSEMNTYLDMVLSGQKLNLALFGQRRCGKTELLKRFRTEAQDLAIVPYLSLERLAPMIEHFCLHFVTELVRSTTREETALSWPSLLLSSQSLGKEVQSTIASLSALMEKDDKDLSAVSEVLFRIPQLVSDAKGLPVVYIIDEFQEIKSIDERILPLMRANTEKQNSVNYWVAGSVFTAFDDLFQGDSPFYGQFSRMEMTRFDEQSTFELVDGLLPFNTSLENKRTIHQTAGGHPFYITAICRRFHLMRDLTDQEDGSILRTSVLMEVFDKTGAINAHLEYLLDVSLAKFRNVAIHRNILLHLSEGSDNLAGISAYVDKPSGEVSNYMKGLVRTDLITKEVDTYRLSDPLMGAWILNKDRYPGELPPIDITVREKVFSDLLERYSQVSSELGKAKEAELREKLESIYEMRLRPYSTPDGQIEFDLIGDKDGIHIFEIKWRNRPVDINTVKRFLTKVDRSEFSSRKPSLYIVSKGGFDPKAIQKVKKYGIHCLDRSLKDIR